MIFTYIFLLDIRKHCFALYTQADTGQHLTVTGCGVHVLIGSQRNMRRKVPLESLYSIRLRVCQAGNQPPDHAYPTVQQSQRALLSKVSKCGIVLLPPSLKKGLNHSNIGFRWYCPIVSTLLLDPDGVGPVRPAGVSGEVTERGEELLHLFLKHLVPLLGVLFGPLSVAQFDLHHGVLLPLLVQLLMKVHHLSLQLQVTLFKTATKKRQTVRDELKIYHCTYTT